MNETNVQQKSPDFSRDFFVALFLYGQLDRFGLLDLKRLVPEAFSVPESLGSIAVVDVTAVMALDRVAHVFWIAVRFHVVQRPIGGTDKFFRTRDRDFVEFVVNLEIAACTSSIADHGGSVRGFVPKHA